MSNLTLEDLEYFKYGIVHPEIRKVWLNEYRFLSTDDLKSKLKAWRKATSRYYRLLVEAIKTEISLRENFWNDARQ